MQTWGSVMVSDSISLSWVKAAVMSDKMANFV